MKKFNTDIILKHVLSRFTVLYLISFITTTFVLLLIGYIMNEKYGYHPLPPFYVVILISFFISIFMFIPWTETGKEKIKKIFTLSEPSSIAETETKEQVPVTNEQITPENRAEILPVLENFITSAVQFLKQNGVEADIYCRIILNLIIAGATEEMASFFSLSENEHKRILHFALKTAASQIPLSGTEPKSFYITLNNPRFAPTHRVLIDFGAASMAKILTGRKNNIFFGFLEIISTWREAVMPELSKTSNKDLDSRFAVLMFTDTTGYSYDTVIPLSAIETHNSITREALKKFGGHEVRALDKGIFAYFDDEADAISAAVFIQQQVCDFNLSHPKDIFFSRIGIHSGNIIADGDELSGSAVKYTAFICSRAKASSVFVSQNIYDKTSASGLFTFENAGYFAPEAGQEPKGIYSVTYDKWQNSIINE